jgi:hypothetical protein
LRELCTVRTQISSDHSRGYAEVALYVVVKLLRDAVGETTCRYQVGTLAECAA